MRIKPMPPAVRAWLATEGHKGASTFRQKLGQVASLVLPRTPDGAVIFACQVTRAFKDKPAYFPSLDEKGVIYEIMMRPTAFLKVGNWRWSWGHGPSLTHRAPRSWHGYLFHPYPEWGILG